MYAMSMRHGWGCVKNEREAVKLLQKATETAVLDLTSGSSANSRGTLRRIATTELTLAIYELAMSFQQGWGVPKSKSTAAYYMTIAAQLGDMDAQMAIGEFYLRGDGVKRDKRKAAQWYRAASKQGAQMVSMQWIWKPKYDN
ncbi:hypothetical protein DFS34DRAFT_642664 [Phlyctochytrium arcticum]|nr:hypothetical protein DFS34DRAFT_642664 [Phlyctochytrium arcticum]